METTQGLLDVLDKLSGTRWPPPSTTRTPRSTSCCRSSRTPGCCATPRAKASLIVSTGLAAGKITPEAPLQLYPICRRHERDVEGAGIVDLGHAVAARARLRHDPRQDRLFRAAISGLARPPRGRAGQGREGRDDGEPVEPAHGRPHGKRGRGGRSRARCRQDAHAGAARRRTARADRAACAAGARHRRLPSARSCWSAAASSTRSTPSATPCSRSPAATLPSTAAISIARTRSARLPARWRPSSSRPPRSSRSRSTSASATSAPPRASARSRAYVGEFEGAVRKTLGELSEASGADAQDLGRSLRGVAPDQRPRAGRRQGLQ